MKKQARQNTQQSRLILEELEERRLFSGGIEGLIDTDVEANAIFADIDGNQQAQNNDDATAAEQRSHEVAFVDAGIENYQQIVDDLRAGDDDGRRIEVVVLDRDKDGIEEISQYLSQYEDLYLWSQALYR